jgi:hypothetical protein
MITCEYLFNSIAEKPLNEDERNAIEYFCANLAKALGTEVLTNGARVTVKA